MFSRRVKSNPMAFVRACGESTVHRVNRFVALLGDVSSASMTAD
jgi:hypothetical protein